MHDDIERIASLITQDPDIIFEQEQRKDPPEVSSVIIFREHEGHAETLIGYRKANPKKESWNFPGGHHDEGESAEEAALRELHEETGIKLGPEDLTFIESVGPEPDRDKCNHIYAAIVAEDIDIEHDSDLGDAQWVRVSELPELAWSGNRHVYKAFTKLFGHKSDDDSINESTDKETINKIINKKSREDQPGLLIVFEGIDGAGKSTQVDKLVEWLEEQDYAVTHTKWGSSSLLKKAISKGKDERCLAPMLYAMIHATDLIARYEHDIMPALERNEIVVCDRYCYTSHVRDKLRGVDDRIITGIYNDLRKPDLLIHCSVPIEVAFARLLQDKGISYYGSGMDLGFSGCKEENCVKYQIAMDKIYNKILPGEPGYCKVDMSGNADDIAAEIREALADSCGIGKYTIA